MSWHQQRYLNRVWVKNKIYLKDGFWLDNSLTWMGPIFSGFDNVKKTRMLERFIGLIFRPRLLIHLSRLEGVLGLWEREYRPYQWPRVSLVLQGTLQIQIWFVRQSFNPTLGTNKHILFYCVWWFGYELNYHMTNW